MEKTEIIIGDLKIVRIDSMNWQIFERRKIKDNHKTSRGGEIDWVAIPAFYGTLKPALVKAKEINRERKIKSGALVDAIKAIQDADADFITHVDNALARLAGDGDV